MDKKLVEELVNDLEMEINNGGFDQYFFNSTGNRAHETIDALLAIKATHTADILRSAVAKFPNGTVPADRMKRQTLLEEVSPDSEAFEVEDEKFLQYKDDLSSLLAAYLNPS